MNEKGKGFAQELGSEREEIFQQENIPFFSE
jgi:hypothetical protein